MSLLSLLRGRRGPNGFGYASTASEVTAGIDLRGKTVLITGVNSGLGAESALALSKRGARILGVARSEQKAKDACDGLEDAIPFVCDLSEPFMVRQCVADVKRQGLKIDVILCNAGIMALQKRTIKHGQELQFLTNHIGHFLLATGLLDNLTDSGRVVMLSSRGHHWAPKSGIQFDDITFQRNYNPQRAYGQSKLANLLFASELSRRLPPGQSANSLHPGVIATNLSRHMPLPVRLAMPLANMLALKSIPEGAATQCFVAVHPSAADKSGKYFADCAEVQPSAAGRDRALAAKLWERTEQIVADLS